MEEVDQYLHEFSAEHSNLHFLQQGVLDMGDFVILGATLWSQIPGDAAKQEVSKSLTDYKVTYLQDGDSLRLICPDDTVAIHEIHVGWLINQLERYRDREVIVLSHHTPSMIGTSNPIHDQRADGTPNLVSHAFSTDLTAIIDANPCLCIWAYGHTHYNNKQLHIRKSTSLPPCTLISNQCGYMCESKTYDSSLVV